MKRAQAGLEAVQPNHRPRIALRSIRGYQCHFFVDKGPFFSYIAILAPLKDVTRRHTGRGSEGGARGRICSFAPGRLGYQPPGNMTGMGGASLDWDRRRRVTPVQTKSQEAWPEAEPLGWNNSLR